jgi:hypothetical protein
MTGRPPTRVHDAASRQLPRPLNPLPAGAPEPVRAVSLGLALLKAAKVEGWDELIGALEAGDTAAARLDGIDLTAADLALLDAHLDLLSLIRVVPTARGRGGFTVTVAVCDSCGRWMISTGTVPRRCRLTSGCPGVLVKAVPAKHPNPKPL